jgi:hypothetical protein
VARRIIFNGTLIELKFNNYGEIRKLHFDFDNVFLFDLSNCFVGQIIGLSELTKCSFDNFIITFQNNVLGT